MEPTSWDAECEARRDDLAALSVGALTGQDRARVLSHLGTCTVCTAELEKYSGAADAMTALVPEAAPPEGFADRTLARVRAESKAPATPLVRRLAAVAAVTVALALGAGVGEVVASSQGGSPATAFLSAPLHSTQGTEGRVVLVSTGQKGWLVMTIHDSPANGTVSCSILLADRTRREVGNFSLADGYGSWIADLPVSATSVRAVTVVDDHGATVASARVS